MYRSKEHGDYKHGKLHDVQVIRATQKSCSEERKETREEDQRIYCGNYLSILSCCILVQFEKKLEPGSSHPYKRFHTLNKKK